MSNPNALRQLRINKVGTRPILWAGGDRELMMFSALIAVVLAVPSMSIKGVLIGLAIWLPISYLLRKMAKADPLMRHAYLQYIKKYKSYYPARSKRFRVNKRSY